MEDTNLTCKDCNKSFVFTASEKDFFQKKGFNTPVRCPECRKAKKSRQQQPRY